ncbi:MAG: hypothetical protein KJZ93_02650 [Caldilineaceae bacterium]|nr:hypothetical protein [Caldilineaceae bacterium]
MSIPGFSAEQSLTANTANSYGWITVASSDLARQTVEMAQVEFGSSRCFRLCVRAIGDTTLCGLICGVIVL